jgi:Spy/CpxP family protein refolding chaperone
MRKLIVLAGAVALASATGVAAQPGNGKGKGQGQAKHAPMKHGGAKHTAKVNGMAPGQAKKLYNVGQRYNRNSGNLWSYSQIPDALRSQYSLDQSDRYYYNSGNLYQVDPKSMLVERVISAVLRSARLKHPGAAR